MGFMWYESSSGVGYGFVWVSSYFQGRYLIEHQFARPHCIVGDLIRFSAMGSEGKTSAFWDKMINEKFVANCLNISKMLKKGGTPVDQSQSGIQAVKP